MLKPILLDTHVWLWMNGAPERLSAEARGLLAQAEIHLFLSTASVWEIAIKVAVGKLSLPASPERYIRERLIANRLTPLAMGHEHALRAAALPSFHRDPFDRMLIAQAQLEELRLMTADDSLAAYDVDLLSTC